MPMISPEKRAAALKANLKKRKAATTTAPQDPGRNRAIPPEKPPQKPPEKLKS